jgi:hypothetical protein
MTIPQKRRGMGFLASYIGGWRVRARDSSNPVPYVRVGPAPGVQERRIMGLIFRQ